MSQRPQTFLVGITTPDFEGIRAYLEATNQEQFLDEFSEAYQELGPIALCSFYAKLCYKSLVEGKNKNISRTRDIRKNIEGCFDVGHGSLFEHVNLNFVTTNCSRVFTHELVRHRVGTAFSQTSGRYVSVEEAELVLPPQMKQQYPELAQKFEDKLEEIKELVSEGRYIIGLDNGGVDFATKKWWTSQLRRIMPSGQTNEIGWSVNIRSLRHMIEMRTSRHAEWEIRVVFNQVVDIIKKKYPLILYGSNEEVVDDLVEYTNLHV